MTYRKRRRFRKRTRGETPAYRLRSPHRFPERGARVPGVCRVCGVDVRDGARGRKRSWHDGRNEEPNCLHNYKMAANYRNYAKRYIARLRGAQCETCSKKGRGFHWLHLDHIVPLADGGTFTEENLQLLCPDCHTSKTSAENSRRARARKDARAIRVLEPCTSSPTNDTVNIIAAGPLQ